MLEKKILTEQQLSELDKEVEAVVEESVKFADESAKPVRCFSFKAGSLPLNVLLISLG